MIFIGLIVGLCIVLAGYAALCWFGIGCYTFELLCHSKLLTWISEDIDEPWWHMEWFMCGLLYLFSIAFAIFLLLLITMAGIYLIT